MASKARGGLSKREFAAKNQGGVLDYKSGKITKPAPKIATPTKKVTYDVKNGKANVSSQPESYDFSQAKSTPQVYGPAIPQGFKQQVSAVKNYSDAKSTPINYSPTKTSREEVIRKSKEEEAKYKKESSTGSVIKNTLKGLFSKNTYSADKLKESGKKVASTTGNILKDTARTVVTTPTKALLTFSGKKEYTPKTKVEKFLVGDEKVSSYTSDQEKVSKYMKEKGMSSGKSVLAGAGLAIGSVGLDIGTAGKGKVITDAIKKGVKNTIEKTGKTVTSGFTRVGGQVAKDAEIRAAGNTAIGKSIAKSGETVRQSMSTPKARASSFADEGASSTRMVSKTDEAIPDNVRRSQRRVEAPLKDEPFQAESKAPIDRTKVAKLKESETALRAKITKALDDAKKAPDEVDELTGKMKKRKDPTKEIDGHINEFRKEFEDLTGEKSPVDPDEMLARLRTIERENTGAWRKQDKRWTREKDMKAMAGVRQWKTFSRGGRRVSGGKLSAKGGSKKGILVEARQKTRIKQDTENYKKSLMASLSQRSAAIKREIQAENAKPKLDLDRIQKLQDELDMDIPAMHQDIRTGKMSEEDLYAIGEDMRRKGHDPFRIQKQGETSGILPSESSFRSLPLKKDDGAIRQIATTERATKAPLSGGNVPRGTDIPPMPKKGPIRKWADEVGTSIREVVQDNWIRVKKLTENPNIKVDPNKLTPYEAEILFHGRVGHRLEQATDTLKTIDQEIVKIEKTLKNPNVRGDIDRYLVAKHAPERNALHGEGAAGMTTEEAKKIVSDFEGMEGSKELKAIAQKIKETNEQTLDILRDSQVIDDATYKTLRETYKEHVPLNRIFDETEDMGGALVGKGYDVRGTGVKKATGSNREVDDILTNVGANLEQAIVRAEKNRVNLATLEFARENKGLGLFQEVKPRAIGESFDGRPLLERIDDPLVLTVRENGKPVYLRINDEHMATVFKGIGNEKLPPVLNFISGFTRLYSGLATRFNPEFVFSNKVRDLQEMAVYMASQKKIGFSGATKAALRDPASMKDVIDHMRGGNSAGAKLYKQMMEDGGTTGGQALSTRKQLKIDLDAIRKLNRGGILNMKQQGKKIIDAFDSWNQIFEDSTRLSAYKGALERGISREQAAILAKNSTINFNKKGTGGPVINGLYMFSNASIQGTTKLLTAMKNPKVAAAVTTSVGTSVWAINSWNDSVDPDWRDKVPEWDRDANMIVMLPGEEGAKYLTIPVSWGLKPMKVMADYAYDASNGKADQKNGWQVVGKVVSSVWDAYNPMGGTDMTSSAVPSFLDIPVEIARNQKFSGAKIRPEDKEGVPASESFFQNKEGVPSDKSFMFGAFRKGTKAIADATGGNIQLNPANLKYALEGYLSGAGRSFTGMAETVGAISGGGLPQASDTPFARRFYKNKTEEEIAKAQKYDAKDDLYQKLKTMPESEQAPVIQEYLNSLPADQRKGAAYGMYQDGFSTKGTTTSDDVIRMKPLVDKINALEDEGRYDEVDQIVEGLSEEDLKSFKNAAKSVKAKATKEQKEALKPKLDPIVDQIIALEDAGEYDKSDELFYSLSEEEQKVAQSLIKSK